MKAALWTIAYRKYRRLLKIQHLRKCYQIYHLRILNT